MHTLKLNPKHWWRRPASTFASLAVGACATCAAHAAPPTGAPPKGAAQATATPAASVSEPPMPIGTNWNAVVEHYAAIATALAADRTDGIAAHAKGLTKALGPAPAPDQKDASAEQSRAAHAAAARLHIEKLTLEDARAAFKPLSEALLPLATANYQKAANDPAWAVFHCPMAPGSWIQTGDVPANPYYGSKMLKCGTKEGMLGAKPAAEPAPKNSAQG